MSSSTKHISHSWVPLLSGTMTSVVVREKGRLTIPEKVRKSLGIRRGDMLRLEVRGDAILLKLKKIPVEAIHGAAGRARVSLEEVEQSLARE